MQIKSVKKLTQYPHLNLYSIQYRDTLGGDNQWIYASRSDNADPRHPPRDTPDAVVVVPFHLPSQCLVVIREFRVVLGDYQYGFPAGLVDRGESVVQAGRRELFEETGLGVTRVMGQSPILHSSSGLSDETVSLLRVECSGEPSTLHTEASEDIEVLLLDRDAAKALTLEDGSKFDVKTWIILEQFASHGHI
ncbi:MAG: NUDIX hydrolase [Desulfobacterales bacterium]|nr:NUDIX hydrolase [Desulfobacterales bacterium]